jgi:hypothetical protein
MADSEPLKVSNLDCLTLLLLLSFFPPAGAHCPSTVLAESGKGSLAAGARSRECLG